MFATKNFQTLKTERMLIEPSKPWYKSKHFSEPRVLNLYQRKKYYVGLLQIIVIILLARN